MIITQEMIAAGREAGLKHRDLAITTRTRVRFNDDFVRDILVAAFIATPPHVYPDSTYRIENEHLKKERDHARDQVHSQRLRINSLLQVVDAKEVEINRLRDQIRVMQGRVSYYDSPELELTQKELAATQQRCVDLEMQREGWYKEKDRLHQQNQSLTNLTTPA